ncbi:hypothetical protein ACE1AT_13890 [Pelatocladus sp. BLCC-F211]|uniref:hypothetical protein n=1 Tax=Pelatocladus sp. BLCC-F211 TaxID=3342752 RepID=UPI0035B850BE
MELTLQQLFGVNAIQDSQSLIIAKTDLPLLTPSVSNTAESLLTAILLKAFENFQGQLTDSQGNKIEDPQGTVIEYNNSALYQLLSIEPWNTFFEQRNEFVYVTNMLIVNQYSEYADTEFS